MKVIDLKKDPIVIEWLQTINSRLNTEKAYLQGMQEFTDYTGKDPEAARSLKSFLIEKLISRW